MLAKLKKSKLVVFLLILLLYGCTTLYNPATGKKELLFIDTKDEVSIGQDMASQVQSELNILDDDILQKRLDKIGQNVSFNCDRQDLKYYFKIVKDDEFNAFALPGGFVYVNSGLLKSANDDELACVLGHEIGHIAAKHSVKRLQANLGYQILINIALGASDQQTILQAVDITYSLVALGYSRKDEFLADRLAIKYAQKSGYKPYGMISFFKKLKSQQKPGFNLVFLSSHPPIEERIKQIEKEIQFEKTNNE